MNLIFLSVMGVGLGILSVASFWALSEEGRAQWFYAYLPTFMILSAVAAKFIGV